MKHILITGANSYIGESFKNWAEKKHPHEFVTDTVDLIDKGWREKSFFGYDVVFHVAGIVHQKEKPDMRALYRKVNIELPVEVAGKAKSEGVKQFIFMSSMSVYGKNVGRIQRDETPIPTTYYGKSKLQAEKRLRTLENESFKIAVLRPPMVYGKGCKGNYALLSRLAGKLLVFPDIRNERSMLFINNLCEFVCLLIRDYTSGIFFPQNEEYVQTSQMVRQIAETRGRKVRLWRGLNPFVKMIGKLPGKLGELENKAFGSLVYEKELSKYKENYCLVDFEESIRLSEQ